MDYWYLILNIFSVSVIANIGHVKKLDVQENERVRLQCTLTSTRDAEEVMWMRIRPPHNPDILTHRGTVVYAPDRIQIEQHRVSSSINANGTFMDIYFLTLTIFRPTMDDEGRYICVRGQTVFAEYDLFVIVPVQFVDDPNFIQQRTVIEGSTLQLSCSAYGRPAPSISWYYRSESGKLVLLSNRTVCQETTCELHLGNYTRYDPKIVECIADNEKSTRVSKIFHIDIYYPPTVITNVRTLIGSRNIDVFLECSSTANPASSVMWLDDNRQEILNNDLYTVTTVNQSLILAFTVYSNEYARVLYYCRSNNSIGTVEKLIDISNFIDVDQQVNYKSTTVRMLASSSTVKQKIVKFNRMRSKLSTRITTAATIKSTNAASYFKSNMFFLIFILCNK